MQRADNLKVAYNMRLKLRILNRWLIKCTFISQSMRHTKHWATSIKPCTAKAWWWVIETFEKDHVLDHFVVLQWMTSREQERSIWIFKKLKRFHCLVTCSTLTNVWVDSSHMRGIEWKGKEILRAHAIKVWCEAGACGGRHRWGSESELSRTIGENSVWLQRILGS